MPKEKKAKNQPTNTEESELFSNKEYALTLVELKKTIQECQIRAITAINKELVHLYWMVGKTIVEKQKKMDGEQVLLKSSPKTYKAYFLG
ncbi:unnamed protein product [Candidatus Protochlamydia amoebophila UWE25]|uniref:YhcG N-terminal domain-containing protein n=1 Tax=Protochlamydia amoebophila (strain UWE25) TaxID=264201 RepID=A0A2P9HA30_PARUW|nr:DUF1016 N-terminal domain-containing protein [Candidatus Protochlamydia amoebophila]SPJ31869.1 unnamed protein product [Candidatus Protochlamydia amoebophila UWE25]